MPYKNKEAQREYQRRWRMQRRQKFFQGKACVKCGGVHDLELDHIDPKKKWSHNIWSYSSKVREREISKCQVLCKECHWKKTYQQQGYGQPSHGKVWYYKRKRCRCELCRKAYSLHKKTYRDKLRREGRKVH